MRFFVTARPEKYNHLWDNGVQQGNIDDFIYWMDSNEWFQLDTETTMIKDGPNAVEDRELILLQLGNIDGDVQWIVEWSALTAGSVWRRALKYYLEEEEKTYILHNALFDYVVIKQNLGIEVENVHDTYLMSQILNTGYELERGYHSLKGCLNRFFGVEVDKEAQTTFTKNLITFKQFMYSGDDVTLLGKLFDELKELLESWNLWYLYDTVEREVVKVYGDMSLNHMKFDEEYWSSLAEELIRDNKKIEEELNQLVVKDQRLVQYLKQSEHVINATLIQPEDKFAGNWASPIHRRKMLLLLIPELIHIEKFTKPYLKKFLPTLEEKEQRFLNLYLNREYEVLNRYLRLYHKDWLLKNKMYIPKDTVMINWSSPIHKLYIFQFYYPNLQNTDAKALARIKKNPIINKYKEFSKVHKEFTTYGAGFKDRYVNRHGMIAPSGFRQILNTGRIAAGILLQMPGQARFRNGFLPPEDGWVFVDSDYSSAELAIMAYLGKEESLLDVIRHGKDAHMFVAQKLFPKEWAEAAEPDCIQMTTGMRCSCPGHEKMRKSGKTFNFGIPYGMTHIGLADRLDIDKKEAEKMLENYYKVFPNLKKFFDESETFGIAHNYIIGAPPTKRIRFFHPPVNSEERNAIGRQAKNFPIQEGNGSMLKIALIKLRKYIKKHKFPARLHLPVHDEILSSCHKDKQDEWARLQALAMEEAADMFLEKGLLKTDTKILDRWTK